MSVNKTSESHAAAANAHGKRLTIIIYPTVPPETVVIPIVSCIVGFPILALLVICCLRRRAQQARERERRRPVNMEYSEHGGLSMIRLSPPSVHRTSNTRPQRAVSLRSDRSGGGRASVISAAYPSLEMLDTVVEERSEDCELSIEVLSTPDT